jgi:hypothetical protein
MNPHSTQVLALLVVSMWAIASAKGTKGRLLALLRIIAFMAGGFALGFVISMRGTVAIRDNSAITTMLFLGALGAIGCIFKNRSRSQGSPFTAR